MNTYKVLKSKFSTTHKHPTQTILSRVFINIVNIYQTPYTLFLDHLYIIYNDDNIKCP